MNYVYACTVEDDQKLLARELGKRERDKISTENEGIAYERGKRSRVVHE